MPIVQARNARLSVRGETRDACKEISPNAWSVIPSCFLTTMQTLSLHGFGTVRSCNAALPKQRFPHRVLLKLLNLDSAKVSAFCFASSALSFSIFRSRCAILEPPSMYRSLVGLPCFFVSTSAGVVTQPSFRLASVRGLPRVTDANKDELLDQVGVAFFRVSWPCAGAGPTFSSTLGNGFFAEQDKGMCKRRNSNTRNGWSVNSADVGHTMAIRDECSPHMCIIFLFQTTFLRLAQSLSDLSRAFITGRLRSPLPAPQEFIGIVILQRGSDNFPSWCPGGERVVGSCIEGGR